jgi:hypothetical protein
MKAADYALLITKGLNAELIAIHVVRSEDALVATNSLIENLDTITTEDSLLQKVKDDAEKWIILSSKKVMPMEFDQGQVWLSVRPTQKMR